MTDQDEARAAELFATYPERTTPVSTFVCPVDFIDFWFKYGPGETLDRIFG